MNQTSKESVFEVSRDALSMKSDECGEPCRYRAEKLVDISKMAKAIGHYPEFTRITTLCINDTNQACRIVINRIS